MRDLKQLMAIIIFQLKLFITKNEYIILFFIFEKSLFKYIFLIILEYIYVLEIDLCCISLFYKKYIVEHRLPKAIQDLEV